MRYNDYDALKYTIWYNGYDSVLLKIADDMEQRLKESKEPTIYHYNYYRVAELFSGVNFLTTDRELRVYWSFLVLRFGDYGTSPRVGWIEDIEDCIKFIRDICKPEEEEYSE